MSAGIFNIFWFMKAGTKVGDEIHYTSTEMIVWLGTLYYNIVGKGVEILSIADKDFKIVCNFVEKTRVIHPIHSKISHAKSMFASMDGADNFVISFSDGTEMKVVV